MHLDLAGQVPGIDPGEFESLARDAKANGPVSNVMNAKITLAVKVEA